MPPIYTFILKLGVALLFHKCIIIIIIFIFIQIYFDFLVYLKNKHTRFYNQKI